MLYAMAFIFLFTIGGLTGLFLGMLSVDVHLHDTYFVVAHFHYVMMGGTVIGFLGGLHYWWPKMTGKMYDEVKAQDRLRASSSSASTSTFIPQFIMGSRGMPRRYYDYLPQFEPFHQASTVGSWILGDRASSSRRTCSSRRSGAARRRRATRGARPATSG